MAGDTTRGCLVDDSLCFIHTHGSSDKLCFELVESLWLWEHLFELRARIVSN